METIIEKEIEIGNIDRAAYQRYTNQRITKPQIRFLPIYFFMWTIIMILNITYMPLLWLKCMNYIFISLGAIAAFIDLKLMKVNVKKSCDKYMEGDNIEKQKVLIMEDRIEILTETEQTIFNNNNWIKHYTEYEDYIFLCNIRWSALILPKRFFNTEEIEKIRGKFVNIEENNS